MTDPKASSSSQSSGRGRLAVVAGPSGVGKSTVVRRIVELDPMVVLAVSATTRPMRDGEVDGVDYRFMTFEEFESTKASGGFLESANFAGNWYGTIRADVESTLSLGATVLLEIELQGVRQIKKSAPDALTIFLAPPSWEVLEARLSNRGTDDQSAVKRRLEVAKTELAAKDEFDETVVNEDVDGAARAILSLICDT